MKSVVILCDGEFPRKAYPLYLLDSADAVVCCDGSVLKYLRYGKRRYGEERLPEAVVGDIVTLMGRDGAEEISASELAGWAGTISYEMLLSSPPRVPREWLNP